MKEKILLVFSSSELGGAERSLTRMSLLSEAFEYHLGTLDGEGVWCDWVRSLGLVPLVFGTRGNSHGRIRLQALYYLFRYLRANKIKKIYVCGIRASLYIRLIAFLNSGTKIIHGVRWNPETNSNLDKFFRLVERYLSGLVSLYIVNSIKTKETLINKCGIKDYKVHVIYNGIDFFPEQIPNFQLRPLNIVTVANLNRRKGHFEYLNVIRKIVAVHPQVKFVFVGRDDMNGELERVTQKMGLKDFVVFEGFKKDVSTYLSTSRIFVLPSLYGEGCPTSILESFSWGTPAIAYDIDGIRELIINNEDGLIARAHDQDDLSEKIIKLLDNPKLSESMGISGYEKVKKSFSLIKCAQLHDSSIKGLNFTSNPQI